MLTLGRIIVDTEYADMYQVAFTAFFNMVALHGGKPVRWKHLHGTGFLGTTVDMCSKQMKGMCTNCT